MAEDVRSILAMFCWFVIGYFFASLMRRGW
jgi:hypothetical protein